MVLEPDGSRLKRMVCEDLDRKVAAKNSEKMVSLCEVQGVDWRGNPCTRTVRLLNLYDQQGRSVQKAIECYTDAGKLKEVAEKFISDKMAIDLANYVQS